MALLSYQIEVNKQIKPPRVQLTCCLLLSPAPLLGKNYSCPPPAIINGFKSQASSRARSRFCEAWGLELTQFWSVFCKENDVHVCFVRLQVGHLDISLVSWHLYFPPAWAQRTFECRLACRPFFTGTLSETPWRS